MTECRFDFHLHSCLSPCAGDDMTPADLAAMCALAGYDAVALTDHNSVDNCPAFCRAAEERGLLALPGMELTCAEEVHVISLFPDLKQAAAFGALVRRALPREPNRPEYFGRQLVMDAEDHLIREETALLSGATAIPVAQVSALVGHFGGVAYPAHIDRPAFSLLSNLGLWMPEASFPAAELSLHCPPGFTRRPDLRGVPFLTGCDAHFLTEIPDPSQSLLLAHKTPQAVIDVLRSGKI